MRTTVAKLVALGALPMETTATVPVLEAFEVALGEVQAPLTLEEASALVSILPRDESSCFGAAWTVIHLIETAPDWPSKELSSLPSSPWIEMLRQRSQ